MTEKKTTKIAASDRSLPLLTEEDILKMPDKDYMNPAQLEFFRDKLSKLREELVGKAHETSEHLREASVAPDPVDRATIEEEHTLELRTRDRESKLLKKIEASIARIESGQYGFCQETDEPIGIERLLVRPTATLCIEEQERHERKQKLFGD